MSRQHWWSCGRLSLAAALLVVFGVARAQAALTYYEPFDYTVGESVDQQAAWETESGGAAPANSSRIDSGSLAGPAGLVTSGNHAFLTGEGGTLQLKSSFPNIAGNDGDTTWISFLAQRQGAAGTFTNWPNNPYPRGVNLSIFDSEGTADGMSGNTDERISVGNSSNAADDEWSIIVEGSGEQRKGNGDSWANLHWAVLRIDHHGDSTVADDAYLWLDPDPNVEPSIASAYASVLPGTDAFAKDYSNLDYLRPFVGNTSSSSGESRPFGELVLDEIRIGTTYGDMNSTSVVPEPATAFLLLCGLAIVACSRRK